MKIAVIGAGAVGGYLGVLLKEAGHDVSFIARGAHLEKMKQDGLTLNHENGNVTVHNTFTDEFEAIRDADLLLFTVKSTETREVCEKIKQYKKKDAYVLTVQNGVINEEILAEYFGTDVVLAGSAYITAKVEEPGVIKQAGGHIFFIGGLVAESNKSSESIATMLQEAGVKCYHLDNIMEKKWEKSLWNVTFNPLSAVVGTKVEEILDDEKLNRTAKAILAETVQIAKYAGYDLPQKTIDNVFVDAERGRHHKTSMLQDRERGKKMEVDALCGYFVQLAKKGNVDIPVLETIYSILSFYDQAE